MARSSGIDIEVMYIEAIQTNKSKRKIDHGGEHERIAKKRKIDVKPVVQPVAIHKSPGYNQMQKDENSCLVSTNSNDIPNEMAQVVVKEENTQIVARIDYKINEVVWAKIKGFPHWPAKLKRIDSNKMVTVVWFNDYRTTKIYKTQLSKFLLNFEQFAHTFEQHIGLKKAAHEALIYFGSTINI